jgi:hypothetical protein
MPMRRAEDSMGIGRASPCADTVAPRGRAGAFYRKWLTKEIMQYWKRVSQVSQRESEFLASSCRKPQGLVLGISRRFPLLLGITLLSLKAYNVLYEKSHEVPTLPDQIAGNSVGADP